MLNQIKLAANGAAKVLKHFAPEILAVSGAVSVIGGVVGTVKQTLKAEEVIEKYKNDREIIAQAAEISNNDPENYPFDEKRAIIDLYIRTALKFAKLYAVPVALIFYGLTGMLSGVFILRRRNAVLMSAYTACYNAFMEYRERVRERYGEEAELDILTNAHNEEIEVEYIDENGKKKKKKETIKVANANGLNNPYSRWFGSFMPDDYNFSTEYVAPAPDDSNISYAMNYNFSRLNTIEKYLNEELCFKPFITLNYALEQCGYTHLSEAGQFVGWSKNPKLKGIVSDHIDLGIDKAWNDRARNGCESMILLSPNCAQLFGLGDKSKAILPMY